MVILDIVCSDESVVVYIIAPVVYIVPVVVVGVGVSGAAIVLAGVGVSGAAIVLAGVAIVIFVTGSGILAVSGEIAVDIVDDYISVATYIVDIVPVVVVGVGVSGAAIVLAGVGVSGAAIVLAGVAIVIFVTGSGILAVSGEIAVDIVDDYISVATYIVDIVPVSKLTSDVATVVVGSGGNLPLLIPL